MRLHLSVRACKAGVMGWLYLSGRNGLSLVFTQNGRIISQVILHHIVVRMEEQEGLGTLDGLFIVLS